MALIDELKAMEAAAQRKRLDSRGTATSIVVGLIVARMEEMHPGSREVMLGQVKAMAEHFVANDELSPAVVEDVVRFAATLLNTSNN